MQVGEEEIFALADAFQRELLREVINKDPKDGSVHRRTSSGSRVDYKYIDLLFASPLRAGGSQSHKVYQTLTGRSVAQMALSPSLRLRDDDVFADLGCGTGLIAALMSFLCPKLRAVLGVEIRPDLLDFESQCQLNELVQAVHFQQRIDNNSCTPFVSLQIGDLTREEHWKRAYLDRATVFLITDDNMNTLGLRGAPTPFQQIISAGVDAFFTTIQLPARRRRLVCTSCESGEIVLPGICKNRKTVEIIYKGPIGKFEGLMGWKRGPQLHGSLYEIYQRANFFHGHGYMARYNAMLDLKEYHAEERQFQQFLPTVPAAGVEMFGFCCRTSPGICHYCLTGLNTHHGVCCCGDCKAVQYCSQHCLEADARVHRNGSECSVLRTLRTRSPVVDDADADSTITGVLVRFIASLVRVVPQYTGHYDTASEMASFHQSSLFGQCGRLFDFPCSDNDGLPAPSEMDNELARIIPQSIVYALLTFLRTVVGHPRNHWIDTLVRAIQSLRMLCHRFLEWTEDRSVCYITCRNADLLWMGQNSQVQLSMPSERLLGWTVNVVRQPQHPPVLDMITDLYDEFALAAVSNDVDVNNDVMQF